MHLPAFPTFFSWCVPVCVNIPPLVVPQYRQHSCLRSISERAAMRTVQAMVVFSWGSDYRCGQERVFMGPMGTTPVAHMCFLQGVSRHNDPDDRVSSLTVPVQQLRGAANCS